MPELPVQTKVPQDTATGSSFNWKKVLIVVVLGAAVLGVVVAGYYYFYQFKPVSTTNYQIEIKHGTSSAKLATSSAKPATSSSVH